LGFPCIFPHSEESELSTFCFLIPFTLYHPLVLDTSQGGVLELRSDQVNSEVDNLRDLTTPCLSFPPGYRLNWNFFGCEGIISVQQNSV
jgi:hypothetical protein